MMNTCVTAESEIQPEWQYKESRKMEKLKNNLKRRPTTTFQYGSIQWKQKIQLVVAFETLSCFPWNRNTKILWL